MQLDHEPTKVLVTGASGRGKSSYWTRLLIGYPAQHKFVFDHEGELAVRLRVRAAEDLAGLAQAANTPWCIFDPARMFPGRLPDAFAFFCDFTFQAAVKMRGSKLFACDELQKLLGTDRITDELALVLETGRRYGIDAVMVAQAPNLIHNRIRNQLTEVVTFQQLDGNALKYLREVGFNDEEVRQLRIGQFVARNLKTGGEARGNVFALEN